MMSEPANPCGLANDAVTMVAWASRSITFITTVVVPRSMARPSSRPGKRSRGEAEPGPPSVRSSASRVRSRPARLPSVRMRGERRSGWNATSAERSVTSVWHASRNGSCRKRSASVRGLSAASPASTRTTHSWQMPVRAQELGTRIDARSA